MGCTHIPSGLACLSIPPSLLEGLRHHLRNTRLQSKQPEGGAGVEAVLILGISHSCCAFGLLLSVHSCSSHLDLQKFRRRRWKWLWLTVCCLTAVCSTCVPFMTPLGRHLCLKWQCRKNHGLQAHVTSNLHLYLFICLFLSRTSKAVSRNLHRTEECAPRPDYLTGCLSFSQGPVLCFRKATFQLLCLLIFSSSEQSHHFKRYWYFP